jgi:signal transduction histidine kinase
VVGYRWPEPLAWALAAVLGVAGVALDYALEDLGVAYDLHYFPLFGAALASTLFGTGPGVLAAVIGSLGEDFFLVEPVGSVFDSFSSVMLFALNLLLALAIASLVGALRQALGETDRLRREAEATSETRRNVLSVVAHDLRGPLTSVRLQAQILERMLGEGADPGQIAPAVSTLDRTAARAQRLVAELFDAMKLQFGVFQVRPRPTPAADLLEGVVELHGSIAAEKGVELQVAHDVVLPEVKAARAEQVLANLVSNAIQHTPAGGHVEVAAQVEGDEVRFSVSDEGPGVSPEEVEQLFGRFWRGGRSDGAGLGLYIAKGIVEANHGRIGVAPPTGSGTRFWFTLPIDDAEHVPG